MSNCNSNTIISINTTCYNNNNFNTIQNSDSNFDSLYNCDKNFNINNNCNRNIKKSSYFYIAISIVVNQISRKSNLVFIKTTLLYTKDKDNNSQI